jgi:hypothetical protein
VYAGDRFHQSPCCITEATFRILERSIATEVLEFTTKTDDGKGGDDQGIGAWGQGSTNPAIEPSFPLHDLHIATSYAKPSLLRILNTLVSTSLVTRRLADGHYRLSVFAGVVRRRGRYDRVAEATAPVLIRLCEKVKWPSDLCVPAGDYMERRETSRPHTPFVLRGMGRPRSVGTRIG